MRRQWACLLGRIMHRCRVTAAEHPGCEPAVWASGVLNLHRLRRRTCSTHLEPRLPSPGIHWSLLPCVQMLLATEGVNIQFTDDAVEEIARVAEEVNKSVDNIGESSLSGW